MQALPARPPRTHNLRDGMASTNHADGTPLALLDRRMRMIVDERSLKISRRTILGVGVTAAAGLGLGCDRHGRAAGAPSPVVDGHGAPDVEVLLRAAKATLPLDLTTGRATEVRRFEGR